MIYKQTTLILFQYHFTLLGSTPNLVWGTVYFKTSLYRPGHIIVGQCLFDSYQIPASILLLFTQRPS